MVTAPPSPGLIIFVDFVVAETFPIGLVNNGNGDKYSLNYGANKTSFSILISYENIKLFDIKYQKIKNGQTGRPREYTKDNGGPADEMHRPANLRPARATSTV